MHEKVARWRSLYLSATLTNNVVPVQYESYNLWLENSSFTDFECNIVWIVPKKREILFFSINYTPPETLHPVQYSCGETKSFVSP